jgi:Fe-S oxidoreductase
MALRDYEREMQRCPRCSECKWVPLANIKSWRFAQVCPSIGRYNFHSYSGGGRLIMGMSVLTGRLDYTDDYLDILYRCQMCGGCDISCKCNKDMEPLSIAQELRIKAVEDGQVLPVNMLLIDGLKKEDNMMQAKKADRGHWAEGLDVKDITQDKADIYFHAGCRYSFDEELWPIARGALRLLKKAGLDVGIAAGSENCCGCRAYEMGYKGELTKYSESNFDMLKAAGVKQIVTPCAECYYAFKVLYPKFLENFGIEVLHVTEYLARLVREGSLVPSKKTPLRVTYHDPCHLGRLGEPYIPWEGVEKKVFQQMYIYEPPKPWRKGTNGIYDAPRDVIRSIPGVELVEMERIKEYAWCCGAGGGVIDGYPDFAQWTALERIEEAKSTGAEVLVTACPWCKRNFTDAIAESGDKMKVLDIVELFEEAI